MLFYISTNKRVKIKENNYAETRRCAQGVAVQFKQAKKVPFPVALTHAGGTVVISSPGLSFFVNPLIVFGFVSAHLSVSAGICMCVHCFVCMCLRLV